MEICYDIKMGAACPTRQHLQRIINFSQSMEDNFLQPIDSSWNTTCYKAATWITIQYCLVVSSLSRSISKTCLLHRQPLLGFLQSRD